MKKFRKIISVMLCCTLLSFVLMGAGVPKSATTSLPSVTSGILLSRQDFNEAFVGNISERKQPQQCNSYRNIELSDIQISLKNDNLICLNANIKTNDVKATLDLSGKLYRSAKAQNGINSLVGNMCDTTNTYNVLLFELF